jgi:hypothetical protein
MNKPRPSRIAAAVLVGALPLLALAHDPGHDHNAPDLRVRLEGYQETPAVSTAARASFHAEVDRGARLITWRLSYADLEGDVQQAHIHFGQRGVAGGISVFLCTNLGNGPAGTPLCPGPRSGMLTGSITPNDVSPDIPATQGAITQGIGPGEFDELIRALRNDALYVNVHSTRWPGGELRAQLVRDERHEH